MKTLYNKGSNRIHVDYHTSRNLRLNEVINETTVYFDRGVSGQFDFRDKQNLDVCGDVYNARIRFNPKANFISLSVVGLRGNFDFSGVRVLYLDHSDVSKANIKFNQNARFIDLYRTIGLRGYLDFSNVQELKLGENDEKPCTSIANISGIKFNPNGLVHGISDAQRRRLESEYKQYEKIKKQLKHIKRITNEKQ